MLYSISIVSSSPPRWLLIVALALRFSKAPHSACRIIPILNHSERSFRSSKMSTPHSCFVCPTTSSVLYSEPRPQQSFRNCALCPLSPRRRTNLTVRSGEFRCVFRPNSFVCLCVQYCMECLLSECPYSLSYSLLYFVLMSSSSFHS